MRSYVPQKIQFSSMHVACPVKYLTHPILNSKVVRSKWICQITCCDHAYAHTHTYTPHTHTIQ